MTDPDFPDDIDTEFEPDPGPVIPAEVTIIADAANRTLRTAIQGIVASIIVAIIPIIQAISAGGLEKLNWAAVQFSAGTAALMAALSYIQRRWLDQSGIPTVLPPGEHREVRARYYGGEVPGP